MILYQVIIITIYDVIIKCATTNSSQLEVTACYENTSSFDILTHKPRVVDVVTGSNVHLWCHFCKRKPDFYPKLWFYKPRGNENKLTEVAANYFGTNLFITPIHILKIQDFNTNNSGVYVCESPEIVTKRDVFTYIVEGSINVDVSPKVGILSQWPEYKRSYLYPINKKITISEEEPFKSLRRQFDTTFKLTTIWDNWGECQEIDHQKGVRKRLGRCRLQPNIVNNSRKIISIDVFTNTPMSFLTDGYDISCRSLQLNKTVHKISEIIRNIPDYEVQEACHVPQRTVNYKMTKDGYKNKKIIKQAAENNHVILLCAEPIANSDIIWFKDGKLLNSLFRKHRISKNEEESHLSIDAHNSLHILHITKNEEGNYSCLSNGKKIQEFEVTVVSKSKLLNQEFIRYSIYLGFVLSLAMTCYCAGVCIAWHRKSSFVDPLNINKTGSHECHRIQCERERLIK